MRSTAHRSSRISDFQVTSQADRANRDIAEAPRFLICARAFRYSLPPPCEPRESCSCPWCKASRRWRRRNLRSSPTTSIVTFSTPSISRPGISYCLLLLMVYRNSTRGPWNNVGGDGIFSPIFADVILTQQHIAAACVVFGISVTTKVPCWHVGRPATPRDHDEVIMVRWRRARTPRAHACLRCVRTGCLAVVVLTA